MAGTNSGRYNAFAQYDNAPDSPDATDTHPISQSDTQVDLPPSPTSSLHIAQPNRLSSGTHGISTTEAPDLINLNHPVVSSELSHSMSDPAESLAQVNLSSSSTGAIVQAATIPQIEPLEFESVHSTASVVLPPPAPTRLKHKLRRFISRWNDWWLLEIIAGMLSIVCLVAIIAILAHFNGKPLTDWHSRITPNAMISVLATISRASVLLPVAECISQLTWLRFRTPHSLQLIQEFDEASRGALGSFQILFSTEAIAAWFGAVITLTSLAFEPFVQQVLLLENQEVLPESVAASVPVSTAFDTGKTTSASFPMNYYPLGDPSHSLDPDIRAAGFNGIYSERVTPPFTCAGATCQYNTFRSLAVCSSCTDVMKQLSSDCQRIRCSSWTFTTPANISIQARYSSGATSRQTFATFFNSSADSWSDFDTYLWWPNSRHSN
jgi:hypothetical protein